MIEAIGTGRLKLNRDGAFNAFKEWMLSDSYLNFTNEETGETVTVQSPKRGNEAYAKKKFRSMMNIVDGMKGLNFDYEAIGRPGLYRRTHLLLITLTFDQTMMDKERAWYLCSTKGGALNLFRSNLTNELGSKATVTVKEAQENGYPAPHILVMIDRPVFIKRHISKKTGEKTWRLSDYNLLTKIKEKWPYGRIVDVEGVVRSGKGYKGYSSPITYLAKYLMKGMNLEKYPELKTMSSIDEAEGKLKIALNTHFWNKLYRMRDIYISKAFKERINTFQVKEEKETSWTLSEITYSNMLPFNASMNETMFFRQKGPPGPPHDLAS